MLKQKSIVLLSGGLDSTVNLYCAHEEGKVLRALTFDYGQRAVTCEIKAAHKLCEKLGIDHEVVSLPWLKSLTKTALVNTSVSLPQVEELDNLQETQESAVRVWVPNRNGVFLNIGASYAESLGADTVVPGFNLEEATTFPDNSSGFIQTLNEAFEFSTLSHVKVKCFTSELNKIEIVKLGKKIKVDFDLVWSCYQAGDEPCGECESCKRSARAFREAGL